jgi:hypothetical protein
MSPDPALPAQSGMIIPHDLNERAFRKDQKYWSVSRRVVSQLQRIDWTRDLVEFESRFSTGSYLAAVFGAAPVAKTRMARHSGAIPKPSRQVVNP